MIDVRLPDFAKVRAKLAPGLVREPTAALIRDAARFAEREAKTGAPGLIARSISSQVHELSAKIVGGAAALAVEFGRHPGTPQPPLGELRKWARARGIPESALFPIARAIRRRGIRGRFFARAAVQKLRATELPRLERKAKADIEQRWRA